jgi:hypothetical protein
MRAGWSVRNGSGVRVAAGTVLEVAVPLDDLEAAPDQPLTFFVSATSPGPNGAAETERYPASRPIQLAVPGVAFSGNNWRA